MSSQVSAAVASDSAITPWSPALLRLTIGGVVTNGASAFASFAVATTMPRTVDDLGGLHYYGWAFSAYMLADIVGLTIAGAESDRRGPGRPYVAGIVCFCLGLLIAGLAPAMPVFIIGRAVQGFGGGLFGSAIYVVVSRVYPDTAKPRMLALLSSSGIVPALVGPAVAGAIADLIDWRAVFLAVLPFMFVAVVLTAAHIRAIDAGAVGGDPNWRRFAESFVLAVSATALIAGLGNANLTIAVPLGVVGLVVTGWMLRRLMPIGTLRFAAGLPAAIGLMTIISIGYFGVDSFVPLALTDIRHRSASFAGLALTAAALAWTGGTWLQAHYADKRSRRQIIRIGLGLIIVATAGIVATLFDAVPVFIAPLAWGLSGLGMGFAYSGVSLTVLQSVERGKEGAATSGMQIGFVLGTALGAGFGGAWLAALSTGDQVNRSALISQNLLMIGVLLVAFVAVRQIPAWPGQAIRSFHQDGGAHSVDQ